jgi:hypothetical protein
MKKILFLSLFLSALFAASFALAQGAVQDCINKITQEGKICTPNNKCAEDDLTQAREGYIDWYCDSLSLTVEQKTQVETDIKNSGGVLGWAIAPLPAPTGLSPLGSNVAVPIVLRWQGTSIDAVKYEYQISSEDTYGDEFESTNQNQSSFSVTQYNTPFRWRVRACPYNENFCSDWAEANFTTAVAPSANQPNVPGGAISSGSSCDWTNPTQICNPLKYNEFKDLLDAIVDFIFTIGMVIAPLLLIIAGFLFVTSAGQPEKVKTAKTMMIAALVGVAVLLLAKGLVNVIVSILK